MREKDYNSASASSHSSFDEWAPLISKLRELRQIKPNRDWVVLTKSQILGDYEPQTPNNLWEILSRILFQPKPVLVGVLTIFILFGLFGFAQNSLPGDILYPIKKIVEKSQAVFVSEEERPAFQLELANKRLEELNKIAQTNQVQKLAPAIKEVKTSLSEATKNLVKSEKVDKEAVDKVVSLKENLEKVERTLATKIGDEEDEENIEKWMKEQTENLIEDLENRTLTEKQEKILAQMKELVEEGKYSEALELYLLNQ